MAKIMLVDAAGRWEDAEDYIFPGLRAVYGEIEQENERHRRNIAGLEEKLQELKDGEQASFSRLLTANGPELREAVVWALRYLEYPKVVNVDEYWKHVIRTKEEDAWLLEGDGGSVEELIRGGHLTLVAVRGGEGGAADDDGLLLQRYKGRRMQEFNNTRMQAVLIGNYFSAAEPKLRDVPFSETQVKEAAQDGNALSDNLRAVQGDQGRKRGPGHQRGNSHPAPQQDRPRHLRV